MSKPKIAVSWNSSCGGCDESIVDIEEHILDVAEQVEFVLWPCAMDFKYEDIEIMSDNEITISLINGGIQNSHQEHIAKMLRKKSQIVLAYGSCACMGGVPSLLNLKTVDEAFNRSYIDSPSNENSDKTIPTTESVVNGHKLNLPKIFPTLYKLDDIIDVDYYLPGCPPSQELILNALTAVLTGNLPPKGTVLASEKSLCTSCNRNETKPDRVVIDKIKRIHQIQADPEKCFLAQGVICMGPATRDGCGSVCVEGNMPCTGCYGPVPNADQGAKMIGTLGSIIAGETDEEITEMCSEIVDPAGTFYRYSTAASLLGRQRDKEQDS